MEHNVWWLGEVPPCRILKFSTKACGGILPNHCYKPFLFVFGEQFNLKTMVFRKLKRVWSHNDMNYIPKFRETFPELNKVSREEMCDRWISLGIDFYTEEKTEVKGWIRLTLPFALILFVLMFIGLPFAFIITGKWSYGSGDKSRILNWFRQLRLV